MQKNISAYTLSNMMFPYPTKSEVIKKVSDAFVIDTIKNVKAELSTFIKNHIFKFIPIITWGIFLIIIFFFKYHSGVSYESLAILLYHTIQESGYY